MSACVNWIALKLVFHVGFALCSRHIRSLARDISGHRDRALLHRLPVLAPPKGKTLSEGGVGHFNCLPGYSRRCSWTAVSAQS